MDTSHFNLTIWDILTFKGKLPYDILILHHCTKSVVKLRNLFESEKMIGNEVMFVKQNGPTKCAGCGAITTVHPCISKNANGHHQNS